MNTMQHPFEMIDDHKQVLSDTAHHALQLSANLLTLVVWLVYSIVWTCVYLVNAIRDRELHFTIVHYSVCKLGQVPESITNIAPGVWDNVLTWAHEWHDKLLLAALYQDVDVPVDESQPDYDDEGNALLEF